MTNEICVYENNLWNMRARVWLTANNRYAVRIEPIRETPHWIYRTPQEFDTAAEAKAHAKTCVGAD